MWKSWYIMIQYGSSRVTSWFSNSTNEAPPSGRGHEDPGLRCPAEEGQPGTGDLLQLGEPAKRVLGWKEDISCGVLNHAKTYVFIWFLFSDVFICYFSLKDDDPTISKNVVEFSRTSAVCQSVTGRFPSPGLVVGGQLSYRILWPPVPTAPHTLPMWYCMGSKYGHHVPSKSSDKCVDSLRSRKRKPVSDLLMDPQYAAQLFAILKPVLNTRAPLEVHHALKHAWTLCWIWSIHLAILHVSAMFCDFSGCFLNST